MNRDDHYSLAAKYYGLSTMQRINISLPTKLLKELDEYCEQNGYNRSELIRKLIRSVTRQKH